MLMIGHLLENLNSHWSKMKIDHPLVTLGRRVAWMLSAKLSIFIRHTLQGAVQRFFASVLVQIELKQEHQNLNHEESTPAHNTVPFIKM